MPRLSKHVRVNIAPSELARLKREAKERRVSVAWIIREAIRRVFARS